MTKARGWSEWNKPTLRVSHSHFLGGNLAGRGGVWISARHYKKTRMFSSRKRLPVSFTHILLQWRQQQFRSDFTFNPDQLREGERDSQRAGGLVSPLSSPKPPFFLSATDRSSEEKPGCAAQLSGFFLFLFFYLPPSFFSFMYFCRISAARVLQRIR